jgi:TonB family protein
MSESTWYYAILGASLKGAVVLCAAWMIAFLLRRRSAAARHLVWTAAAAAVLALPFLALLLPALPVRASNSAINSGLVFRVFAIAAPDIAVQASPSFPAPAGQPGQAPWHPDARTWLIGVWALGAAVAVSQMLIAYAALMRLSRAARPSQDPERTHALARSLGITHDVRVLETASATMPMTFGVLRSSILMPSQAIEWSEERRRMVLLHELAHVRRGDVATHLMARLALSLNWWNPLAWTAWREFLKERERAADDLVLTAGARPPEYASHLLEVARSLQSAPATASAAVAMARRSQLEGRLLAILDAGVNRKPAGRIAPAVATLLAVLVAAPFAAIRAQERIVRADPPEVEATIRAATAQHNYEILDNAADAYRRLGKNDIALSLLEQALAIRGQVAGQQSSVYAGGLVKLGDLTSMRKTLGDSDSYDMRAVALGDRVEVAPSLIRLGQSAAMKGNTDEALAFYQRALNVAPTGPQASLAYRRMAMLPRQPLQVMRDYLAGGGSGNEGETETYYQKSLAAVSPDSPDAAATMDLYARFLRQQNRVNEADAMEARVKEIRKNHIATMVQQTARAELAVRVGNGVTAPSVLYKRDPDYTEEARSAKYQGTVLLGIDVGADGYAYNIRVIRSLGLGLDEKAIEAVSQWRFRPGMRDGQPVTVQATIEINFRLL